jgi:hypothetical protein
MGLHRSRDRRGHTELSPLLGLGRRAANPVQVRPRSILSADQRHAMVQAWYYLVRRSVRKLQ